MLSVRKVDPKDTHRMILEKHYAQRLPQISYAYGLFKSNELVGVCTLGKPVSHYLCTGVSGPERKQYVYELNRLIVEEGLGPNSLSYFVSRVLRDLKKDKIIVVSYADTAMNHAGYIYQATNFIYTGKTKSRTDKYSKGHSRHYTNEKNHLRKYRSSKHRYVYFTDKDMEKYLRYPREEYPKTENGRYVLGERLKTKIINTDTNEIWYE